jgi:glyoxylase-like metal-dependent hydrolase (beta-lactamase superfamily II)
VTPTFINSATVDIAERLVLRSGAWRPVTVGVRYAIAMHKTHGPVLIDTGYGPRVTSGRRSITLTAYAALLRPRLRDGGMPQSALARLGCTVDDVRRIVLTHFHADHVAAARDFPNASFIASGTAWAAIARMGKAGRLRHGVFDELLPDDFAARLLPIESCAERPLPSGFGLGHDLFGDGACLAVDLPGHALGHFGLIWMERDAPLLYAVDTTWIGDALEDRLPHGPAHLVYADAPAMTQSAARVEAFRRAGGEVVLCHERVTR